MTFTLGQAPASGTPGTAPQDAAYAGKRLLAVADGYGSAGGPASAAAIEALKDLEGAGLPAGNLLNVLEEAVQQAERAVHHVAGEDAGTTLTAMLWTGSRLALVHIGDSRAYLLRAGELFQITHDHTFVQSMLDEGRISPEEATAHPQRSMLLRALSGRSGAVPDIRLHDVLLGDRYLLCSDGLSAVVATENVHRVLAAGADPEQTARELIDLANRSGGPDNVSCVIADVVAE